MNFVKYIISTFLIFMFSGVLIAQEKRLMRADENFRRYAFVDARKIYLDVAEKGYASADLFKKIGDSYYFNGQLEKSVVWYEKLVKEYSDDLDTEYLFRYAQSLKSIKQYDEADQIMQMFYNITNTDQRAVYFVSTRDYLRFIEMQSGKFTLKKISINSSFSDYAPSFDNLGNLVFASSRGSYRSVSKVIHEWNEMPFLDLYKSDIINEKDELGQAKKLKGKINTKFHESSTSFSSDGQIVYFTRNNFTKKKLKSDANGTILLKLYRARLEGSKWVDIEELPFNSEEYSVAHPALTADGKYLYFASDMPDTRGLSDLYKVEVFPDGTFGEPINLGDKINTEGRETFPYISNSGRLYFASDGHVGLGGLDIFVTVPEEGTFSIPYNIGKPVNSSEDDFSFVLNEETKIGYFSSNRKGGKGNDDIYSFKQIDELITTCRQYVSGVITEDLTGVVLPNSNVILLDNDGNEIEKTISNDKGVYSFNVECEESYIIRALKDNYNPSEDILLTNTALEYTHKVPLQLSKGGLNNKEILPGDDLAKVLDLQIIYFDLDKSFIRPDAEIELQKIIAAMKEYLEIKIDVRSHTDSRAPDSYNLALSERRAKSTIKYIVERGGIDPSRITGRGYGESSLVNECDNTTNCNEKQHQENRRSEFILLE
ncbi:Outer membrane protein OmpA [Aquimarina amphilecti]|uniref:Outer membrane protein OmpA n=1 Tax=Aquimarina amphilecti TaxID=1038014 RepID=A0A1H7X1V2_AQUAM|nr:OmpA family protein [Aquimarina amphilecti]SEM27554.1 Outer membrane protein OmpA [Aquimarina amphilecti]